MFTFTAGVRRALTEAAPDALTDALTELRRLSADPDASTARLVDAWLRVLTVELLLDALLANDTTAGPEAGR